MWYTVKCKRKMSDVEDDIHFSCINSERAACVSRQ